MSAFASTSEPTKVPEECQSADIWDLGCVYVEICVWLVHGLQGLREFRSQRKEELDAVGDVEVFRRRLLSSTSRLLNRAEDGVRDGDKDSKNDVTGLVFDVIVRLMLCYDRQHLPTAEQLWAEAKSVMDEAARSLHDSKPWLPAEAQSFQFGDSTQSLIDESARRTEDHDLRLVGK